MIRRALNEANKDFCKRRGITSTLDNMAFLEAIGATKNGKLSKGGLLFLGTVDAIRSTVGDYEFRFSWKKKSGELEINDVWSSCIWEAIKRVNQHFESCNTIQLFSYKDNTFSAPLLDEVVFHEAYLNAVVHRDYSSDGMISVSFSGDKLVITSPGRFYGGITSENIAKHEPRHPK